MTTQPSLLSQIAEITDCSYLCDEESEWCCTHYNDWPCKVGRITALLGGGLQLIAAERRRQIDVEGRTPEHDIEHTGGDLALAAACYALPEEWRSDDLWPWHPRDWKPTPGDRVRELVKAGALIAAELDRLRAAPAAEGRREA